MSDPNDFNQRVIDEFRANDGVVTILFEGAPVMLLTHRGARSGTEYTCPLVYTRDGERIVIIASKGGAPDNPQWFHNLVANPDVVVEVGPERYAARARVTEGEERARLYAAQAVVMPFFNDYAQKCIREIPVIVLERT